MADLLGREEGVEDVAQRVLVGARSVIAHPEADPFALDGERDLDHGRRVARHGVKRVEQQIEQHLLQAHRAGQYQDLGLRHLLDHLDASGLQAASQEFQGFIDHRSHRDRLEPTVRLAREGGSGAC